jgi:hypothetical protein
MIVSPSGPRLGVVSSRDANRRVLLLSRDSAELLTAAPTPVVLTNKPSAQQ